MALYLGIDSGTQGVKAIALDAETGRIVARTRAPHRIIPNLPPGHVEQRPEEWAAALNRVLRSIARRCRGPIRGIGIAAQQHGFVPLDARGEVIRPAKLWCDTSTQAECAILTRKLGGAKAVLRTTGMPFLTGYTAPKILWLKRNEPSHFRRLRRVLLPHDFLNFHLTGSVATEAGDASGTALMDVRRRRWSLAAAQAVDPSLPDWLPPILNPGEPAGVLRGDLARQLGLPAGLLVSAGGGDNMMGAIGTGAVSKGIVTASIGTSGTLYAFRDKPLIDPLGEIAAFCSSTGGWLPLVCTLNASGAADVVRLLLRMSHAQFEQAIEEAPAGARGLVHLPYLAGERCPNLPDASGVFFGATAGSLSPGCLARATLEGIAIGMNRGLRRLQAFGIRTSEVRVIGGAARSRAWRQMLADVFDVPVIGMAGDEAAARGAALQAAACESGQDLGSLCSRWLATDPSSQAFPSKERVKVYRAVEELHRDLSLRVAPLFPRQRAHATSLLHEKGR